MRLWTLHPKYLDSKGLVALWREALLAQAVLKNETKGYKNHPQLDRFYAAPAPVFAIAAYLEAVWHEAQHRGYRFNAEKITPHPPVARILATTGQMDYESAHLLKKLMQRDPARAEDFQMQTTFEAHPLFEVVAGGVADWEIQ